MKEDLLKKLLESVLGRSKAARGGDEAVRGEEAGDAGGARGDRGPRQGRGHLLRALR